MVWGFIGFIVLLGSLPKLVFPKGGGATTYSGTQIPV